MPPLRLRHPYSPVVQSILPSPKFLGLGIKLNIYGKRNKLPY